MADDKVEGNEKVCGNCKTALICVKIEKEWQGKKDVKLQWQSKGCRKAHFKFAGEKDGKTQFNCQNIESPEDVVQASMPETPKPEAKPEINPGTIKVSGPFDEAELIVKWARERAYKITMAEVSDIHKLSQQEKSGLGQAQGMLTRALIDTTIELMKIHGIKTEYK